VAVWQAQRIHQLGHAPGAKGLSYLANHGSLQGHARERGVKLGLRLRAPAAAEGGQRAAVSWRSMRARPPGAVELVPGAAP
jgi:hypothetical protein